MFRCSFGCRAQSVLVALVVVGLLSACSASTPSSRASINDRQLAWAVGAKGTIIATSDGGLTWARQDSGSSSYLFGITFADALHGWAVGDGGTIVATTDGGEHWTAQDSGTTHLLTSVTFVDPLHGWAVGDAGVICATSDGGATWLRQHSGQRQQLSKVVFADRDIGWAAAAGRSQLLLTTVDGGEHWATRDIGLVRGTAGLGSWGGRKGWIVDAMGELFVTSDGGVTWNRRSATSPIAYTDLAAFPSQSRGWVVGDSGELFMTDDGGRHWVRQQTGVDQVPIDGAFINGMRGFILGENQLASSVMPADAKAAILATFDGGKHWQKQVNPVTAQLSAIACVRQP